jgi:hypothetical protein
MESDPEPDPDPLARGADPDPQQNVTDPQHWLQGFFCCHVSTQKDSLHSYPSCFGDL